MSLRARHSIAWFFLLLTAAPLIGMGGLQLAQLPHRYRAEAALEERSLLTLKLPEADVHWYRPGHELLINGELFDVKTVQTFNGTLTVTGLFDKAESAALLLLDQEAAAEDADSLVLLLLAAQSFTALLLITTQLYRVRKKHFFIHRYSSLLPHPFSGFLTPPPRLHY